MIACHGRRQRCAVRAYVRTGRGWGDREAQGHQHPLATHLLSTAKLVACLVAASAPSAAAPCALCAAAAAAAAAWYASMARARGGRAARACV